MINVGDWIRKWSILQPKKKALYFEDQPFTYQEVNHRINQLCHLLLESDLKKEDRVAVLLHNCHQYIEIFLGLSKIGAILVPLNWRLAGPELEFILQDSGSRVLIFEPEFEDEKWGEVGKAYVVLKPGETMMEEEALKFLRGKVGKYKIPKYMRFVEQLPKTASSKIQKFLLKEWHQKKL